jgi:excisionase family DNA binding protein
MRTARAQRPLVEQTLHPIETVAERLGVSTGVIYRLVHTGQLGCIRVGRRMMFPEADIDAYLARNYQPASSR